MENIHEVDLKCKCILLIGKSALADVISFLALHHKDGNTNIADEALWNILNTNQRKFNKLKRNCRIPIGTSTTTGAKYVTIKNLDISAQCAILNPTELNLYESQTCCVGCDHECISCTPNRCDVWCNKGPCNNLPNCEKPATECSAVVFMKCEFVIHNLRNIYNHVGDNDIFKDLVDRKKPLPKFPLCVTWETTWGVINTAIVDCLKILKRVNFISKEKYKNYKMDLRICLCKSKDDLWNIFGRNLDGIPAAIHEVKEFVKEKLERQIKVHMCDFVVFGEDLIHYPDPEHSQEMFTFEKRIDRGVVLRCKKIDAILNLQVQKQGKQWIDASTEFYSLEEDAIETLVTIQNLKPEKKYNVRMLTKGNTDDVNTVTATIAPILIKEIPKDEFVEIGGKTYFTGDIIHQNKELDVITKIPEGGIFSFDGTGVKQILRVEIKKSNETCWRNHISFSSSIDDENRYQFMITQLDTGECFDIRILVQCHDEETYDLFFLRGFKSEGKAAFCHVSNLHNTVLFCHPLGLELDAHHTFNDLRRKPTNGSKAETICFKLGGETICQSVADIDNYIDINFPKQNVIAFPPMYMLSKETAQFKIVSLFHNVYEKESGEMFFAIVSGVDTYKHLQAYGYSDDDTKSRFPYLPTANNMIAVYDSRLQTVFVITLPTKDESLHQLYQINDAHVSAFLTLNQHVLELGKVVVIGVVAATHLAKEGIANCRVSETCSKFVLSRDDVQSDVGFAHWLKTISKEIMSKSKKYGIEVTDNRKTALFFKKFASRLFVAGAVANGLHLPPVVGSDHDRIQLLVLNIDQRLAISNPAKKKVIKGQYGSGKSIVIQHILEKLARQQTDGSIYYVGFDEYTLHQVEMERTCDRIRKGIGICQLTCKNIRDLSLESGVDRTMTLKQCLEYLCKCHPNGDLDILVDEYDGEELTLEDAKAIADISNHQLKDSNIIISVQSCEKVRMVTENGTEKTKYQMNCFKQTGMEILELTKTMRYTCTIHDLVMFSQNVIEELENVYEIPNSVNANETTFEEAPASVIDDDSNVIPSIEKDIEYKVKSTSTGGQSSRGKPSILPQTPLDTLMKRFGGIGESGARKLFTTFQYFKKSTSGHGLCGTVPSLLKLQSSLTSDSKVKMLTYYMKKVCFQDLHEKAMLVCNNLSQISLLKRAMEICGIKYVEYTDSIRGNSTKDMKAKRRIYNQWLDAEEMVLIVDSRGSRGLEYEKVILTIDEKEYYERHLLIESLTRCASKLFIASFEEDDDGKVMRNTGNLNVLTEILVANECVMDVTDKCVENQSLYAAVNLMAFTDSNEDSFEEEYFYNPENGRKELLMSLSIITRDVSSKESEKKTREVDVLSTDDMDSKQLATNIQSSEERFARTPVVVIDGTRPRTRINSKNLTHEYVYPNEEENDNRTGDPKSPIQKKSYRIYPYESMYPETLVKQKDATKNLHQSIPPTHITIPGVIPAGDLQESDTSNSVEEPLNMTRDELLVRLGYKRDRGLDYLSAQRKDLNIDSPVQAGKDLAESIQHQGDTIDNNERGLDYLSALPTDLNTQYSSQSAEARLAEWMSSVGDEIYQRNHRPWDGPWDRLKHVLGLD